MGFARYTDQRAKTVRTVTKSLMHVLTANILVRCRMVHVFSTMPGKYNTNRHHPQNTMNYIRILRVHLEVYKLVCPLSASEEPCVPTPILRQLWQGLWVMTATSLQKYRGEERLNKEEQCNLALESIDLLDGFEKQSAKATALVGATQAVEHGIVSEMPTGEQFPAELYAALLAFVPERDAAKLAPFTHIQRYIPPSHRWRALPDAVGGGSDTTGEVSMIVSAQANPPSMFTLSSQVEGLNTGLIRKVDPKAEGGRTGTDILRQ